MLTVEISKRKKEADDIISLELVDPACGNLPPFSAGSHVDVVVSEGLVRQYSLCNSQQENHRYVIAVLRDPNSRGGSDGMHEHFIEGKTVRISEPRNHFPLAHDADSVILIAGGIGITPILCMANRLLHIGVPFEMHYCSRSKSKMAFLDDVKSGNLNDFTKLYFDDDPRSKFDAASAVGMPGKNKHLYVCGPIGFIENVLSAARIMGWSAENLHREYFGADAGAAGQIDEAFEVEIGSTGEVYEVPPGRSVINILSEHGIDVPASCEQGVCGTCLTRVLNGEPDHRDMYLTDDERERNDQFIPCCSRSKTYRLVLDL